MADAAPIAEAAEKLGWKLEYARRYAAALKRWRTAGYPVRSPEDVHRVWDFYCEPCDERIGNRCRLCGCRLGKGGLPIFSKIKMATEHCAKKGGKW